MKTEIRYICNYDNTEHKTQYDATKHLEKVYADLLLSISRNLSGIETKKYTRIAEYIDTNLGLFLNLSRIKLDKLLEDDY